jgi:hypothetical protein
MNPNSNSNSKPTTTEALPDLRSDLRRLVALESVQAALGVGGLVAIALHAVTVSADRDTALLIASATLLALTYLALAFRIRLGQDLLRRDLHVMEFYDELSRSPTPRHPYRASSD